MYFTATHNTGTGVEVYTVGDLDDVGGGPQDGVPYAPASELWCPFVSPEGNADVRAVVDTTYASGLYDIGYFPGGGEAYLTING